MNESSARDKENIADDKRMSLLLKTAFDHLKIGVPALKLRDSYNFVAFQFKRKLWFEKWRKAAEAKQCTRYAVSPFSDISNICSEL